MNANETEQPEYGQWTISMSISKLWYCTVLEDVTIVGKLVKGKKTSLWYFFTTACKSTIILKVSIEIPVSNKKASQSEEKNFAMHISDEGFIYIF